jgi:hypothetical protein
VFKALRPLLLVSDAALRLFTVVVKDEMFDVFEEVEVLRPLTVVVNAFTLFVRLVNVALLPPELNPFTVVCKVDSEVLSVFKSSLKPVT